MGFVQEHSKLNFHYRTNSVKLNFSANSENLVFGPFLVHVPNFWGKKYFSRKSGPVMPNFIRDSSNIPKSRKIMIHFQENAWTEGWKDGKTDGKALFHRTLPDIARGPTKGLNGLGWIKGLGWPNRERGLGKNISWRDLEKKWVVQVLRKGWLWLWMKL